MKTLVVFALAALSVTGLHAQDAPPPVAPPVPDQTRKPLPPLERERDRAPFDHGDRSWGGRRWMGDGQRPDLPMKKGKRDGDRALGGKSKGDHPRGPGRPDGDRGPRAQAASEGDGSAMKLAAELQLTDEQRKQAREIMVATRPKIEAIREEGKAKVKSVMEDAVKELRPLLTSEQQAVFDDLQKLRADKIALDAAKKAAAPAAGEVPEKPKAAPKGD